MLRPSGFRLVFYFLKGGTQGMGYRTKDLSIVKIYKPDREAMLHALQVVYEIYKERSLEENKGDSLEILLPKKK